MSSWASPLWVLRRALAMTPPEVALRAVRGLRRRVRRAAAARPQGEVATLSDVLGRAAAGVTEASDPLDLIERRAGTFLRGATDREALRDAIVEIGGTPDGTIDAAEAILSGRIPAFGWTDIDAGWPTDWHRDPASGERWPLKFWSDVEFRFADLLGDPRYVWEVNRHHHLVTLARAFVLSGSGRYARGVWQSLGSWIEANPPYHGINWVSALEVGIRLVSWSMALDLVGGEGAEHGDAERVTVSVSLQADHVCDNLSSYASSKNNHLIGEAAALIVASACFPRLAGAPRWAAKGRAILERELDAQVHPDGVGREQAFHYQVFVLEFCLAAAAAARASGRPLSRATLESVGLMARFLDAVAGRSGEPPSVGDEDGGRAYDLADLRGRQSARAAACGALAAGIPPSPGLVERDLEPALWLFGPGEVRSWLDRRDRAKGEDAPRRRSPFFPEGGYYVPAGADQHGVIDCGPLGFLSIAAHGHADCLSLTVCLEGEWLVVDPGTFCYHRDRPWRDHFRGTGAHNTVTVDGRDQSESLGPFLWGRQARARPTLWAETDRFVLFEGSHDGYRGRGGVRHSRRVLFGSRGYWIVVDRVEGTGRHHVSATFQLAPGLSPTPDGAPVFQAESGVGIAVEHWLPESMVAEVIEGRERPPGGWCSPGFGLKVPAPAVIAAGDVELPVTMVFVLVPFAGKREIDVSGPGRSWSDGVMLSAEFPEGRDLCLFGDTACGRADSHFRGRFGFAAVRQDATEFFGLGVEEWKEAGTDIEYEAVHNLVPSRRRGKE